MKKLLLFLFAFGVLAANAQQYSADTLIAKQKIKLHGYSVTTISNDTSLAAQSPFSLPTQYAVYEYINNHAPASQNFANTDLSFTGNRSHNLKRYNLTLDSAGVLNISNDSIFGVAGKYNDSVYINLYQGWANYPTWEVDALYPSGNNYAVHNVFNVAGGYVQMNTWVNDDNRGGQIRSMIIKTDSLKAFMNVFNNQTGKITTISVRDGYTEIGLDAKDNRIGAQPASDADSIAGFVGDKMIRIPKTALTIANTDALAEGSTNFWWKNIFASNGFGLTLFKNTNGKDFSYGADTTKLSTIANRQKAADSLGALIAANTTAIATNTTNISGKVSYSDTTVKVATPTQLRADSLVLANAISAKVSSQWVTSGSNIYYGGNATTPFVFADNTNKQFTLSYTGNQYSLNRGVFTVIDSSLGNPFTLTQLNKSGFATLNFNDSLNRLQIGYQGTTSGGTFAGLPYISSQGSLPLIMGYNGTEKARISGNGLVVTKLNIGGGDSASLQSLSIASGNNIRQYQSTNTATNAQFLSGAFVANQYQFITQAVGTGSAPAFLVGNATNMATIYDNAGQHPGVNFKIMDTVGATGNASATGIRLFYTNLTGASGTQISLGNIATVNGTGSEGYVLQRNAVYEQGTGTGIKKLAQWGISTSINAGGFTEKASIDNTGKINFEATITPPGTDGNQTINKPSGTINIAATGTSVVLTNSLITTSSNVFAVIKTHDATAYYAQAVPASGSCTFYLNAPATNEVVIGWEVHN